MIRGGMYYAKQVLPVRIESPIKVEAEVKATMVGDNGKVLMKSL